MDILDEAKEITSTDRTCQYGPATQDFARTAELLTAMLRHKLEFGAVIEPGGVACIMIGLKLSRIQWSPGKRDHWVDIAGYARCGWQCVDPEPVKITPEAPNLFDG